MVYPTGLSRRRLVIAAILAATMQTGILASMIREGTAILADGVPVTLRTVPVDPRDLLRGEYVVLSYDISRIESGQIVGDWPQAAGDAMLYVELAPEADGVWHPLIASFSPLEPAKGNVVIRSRPFSYLPSSPPPSSFSLEYGLERYYVPEGQGKELEKARNDSRILVDARIMPDGTARIASLRVEPEPPKPAS